MKDWNHRFQIDITRCSTFSLIEAEITTKTDSVNGGSRNSGKGEGRSQKGTRPLFQLKNFEKWVLSGQRHPCPLNLPLSFCTKYEFESPGGPIE